MSKILYTRDLFHPRPQARIILLSQGVCLGFNLLVLSTARPDHPNTLLQLCIDSATILATMIG